VTIETRSDREDMVIVIQTAAVLVGLGIRLALEQR